MLRDFHAFSWKRTDSMMTSTDTSQASDNIIFSLCPWYGTWFYLRGFNSRNIQTLPFLAASTSQVAPAALTSPDVK